MHRPTSFEPPPTTLNIQQVTFTYTYLESNWIQPLIKASPESSNCILSLINIYNLVDFVWDAEFHITFKRGGRRMFKGLLSF